MDELLSIKIQSTQEYSVFITDEKFTGTGSGLLYYQGGDVFFVFTCRHVIAGISSDMLHLYFLLPIDPENDDYQEFRVEIPKTQVAIPPQEESEQYDFVVIPLKKENHIKLNPTNYFVNEATKNQSVFIHGFPGGKVEGEMLLEALDYTRGTVLHNIHSNHRFSLRDDDSFLDQGNRRYELEGFSGSPVWEAENELLSVTGLLSAGARMTVYRSRVYAEKMEYIRSFMKNRFDIYMKTKLEAIPEVDVAGETQDMICYNGTIAQLETETENDKWFKLKIESIRGYIDDLKYEKAIDTAKAAIDNEVFEQGRNENQRRLMQHLLYCYEIVLMDDDFEFLEKEMNRRELIIGHDHIRSMTATFSRKEYQKTLDFAEKYLKQCTKNDYKVSIAKVFISLSKVYIENLSYEESIKPFLNEKDSFTFDVADAETESLIYQMIGYVLSEHYHRHSQAIRCLNRAYRVGFDKMVLESLACEYYFMSIANATDADDKVKISAIDRSVLYKARECFIIIMDKADGLFWKSAIKRIGIIIYNTFVFSMDNYRSIRVYSDVKKYLPDLPQEELHDVELKYAKIDCQKGDIDFAQYKTLTEQDCCLLMVMADLQAATLFLQGKSIQMLRFPVIENQLRTTIQNAENNLSTIKEADRLWIRVTLINLYGRGIFVYNWNVINEIKIHFDEIQKNADPELIKSMQNFIFECEHPFEEAVSVFEKCFEEERTLINWYELCNLYIRHFKLNEADILYKKLFLEHRDLIEPESEFVYRSYIDYVTINQRNVNDALKCFLEAKTYIKDVDIENYWELELMLYTNTFNEPERFEEERLPYVRLGLMPTEVYHRGAFIAYMLNLNLTKAKEHNIYPSHILQQNYFLSAEIPNELLHFMAWQRLIRPVVIPQVNKYMLPQNELWVEETMNKEEWHHNVKEISGKYNLSINRMIAVDAWTLCLLAFDEKLELLEKLDMIYVSHATISRLMEQAKCTALYQVHQVLEYIETHQNVLIRSADFKHQIEIRENLDYDETASVIAIAYEKGCPVVLGEPELKQPIIDNYSQMIVRANMFKELLALAYEK
ncbi:MAG: hypothetical protein PHS82_10405 [Lachnospiraceae bacterium]|nr:hypothetical protein [Lachnospiraceae bacterium]